jgi:hypothetical protein
MGRLRSFVLETSLSYMLLNLNLLGMSKCLRFSLFQMDEGEGDKFWWWWLEPKKLLVKLLGDDTILACRPDRLLGEWFADVMGGRPAGKPAEAAANVATANDDLIADGWLSTHLRMCFSNVLGTENGMLQNLQL